MNSITQMNKVTVLLPIHGPAPFLMDTLLSICKQDFSDFSCLLILDRVRDDTKSIIESFCRTNSNFMFINSKGIGISDALNTGLSMVETQFVARVDSDDLMEPHRLSRQMEFMKSNSDIALLGTQIQFINEHGEHQRNSNYVTSSKKIAKLLPIRNTVAHPSVMFRSSTIIAIGGYDSTFDGCEDYHLWLKVCTSNKIENLDETLTKYRQHSQQITNKSKGEKFYLESLARLDVLLGLSEIEKKQIKQSNNSLQELKKIRRAVIIRNFKRHRFKLRVLLNSDFLNRILTDKQSRPVFSIYLYRTGYLILSVLSAPFRTMDFMLISIREFKRRRIG